MAKHALIADPDKTSTRLPIVGPLPTRRTSHRRPERFAVVAATPPAPAVELTQWVGDVSAAWDGHSLNWPATPRSMSYDVYCSPDPHFVPSRTRPPRKPWWRRLFGFDVATAFCVTATVLLFVAPMGVAVFTAQNATGNCWTGAARTTEAGSWC